MHQRGQVGTSRMGQQQASLNADTSFGEGLCRCRHGMCHVLGLL